MTITCPVIDKQTFSPSVDFIGGAALLIDKPKDWTSFDVVAKIRNRIGKHLGVRKLKVGHAGTLDPLATGLLILCIGKATKQIEAFQGLYKEYVGTIKLGATTKTYDAEGEEENLIECVDITEDQIKIAIQDFIGVITQKPPIFSALKVKGKALYKYARKGESVEIKTREVTVHEYTVLSYTHPYIEVQIKCSKGTYIRSLAHDLGQTMGCGAYLADLRRTAIGEHGVNNALSIEEIIAQLSDESV